MKKLIGTGVVLLLLVACKKETCTDGVLNQDEVQIDCGGVCTACPITYPETGTYGPNLLDAGSINFVPGDYSMRAEIPEGSTLKVILYNVDGGAWFWSLGTNTNCMVGDITSSQTFEAITSGTMDININLPNGSGTILVQYFENSTSETKQKTIYY